ncbi:MAG: glycosyltransferase family 4 protein [Pleurocapsa minor GSE-CHR-MK-17-07R]|jgi:glycosyltransferase involved in cell wall biosynthesis|nr:glycosyltransferase family 4 protein [Pleurocapsa minor GSE-CHR-MK 17-07R]
MSNLLLFNLAMDADDDMLAFTTTWANRLAAHYERVDVITMRAGRIAAADNVHVWSVGKEKGFSEARRTLEFYGILLRLLRERRYRACFAHMNLHFAVLAGPILNLARVPLTLWYVHRSRHWTARVAPWFARAVATSVPDSFPFPSRKVHAVGHAVDTDFFIPSGDGAGTLISYVARVMPIKHHGTLIRALARLPDAQAVCVGGASAEYAGWQAELEALADKLGVAGRVRFAGPQPPDSVLAAHRSAAFSVNLSPAGLFDKSALEAMACALPTVVSNPAFLPALGADAPALLISSPDDDAALADKLGALLALPADARRAMGLRLRDAVVRDFSLHSLIPRLVQLIEHGHLNESDAP